MDPDGRIDWYFMQHSNDDIGIRARKFSSDEYKSNTNCASWAFNLVRDFSGNNWQYGYQPGETSNNTSYKNEKYINGIESALLTDGLDVSKSTKEAPLKEGEKKIALATMKNGDSYTYHFLVQEIDGKWTQKEGIDGDISSIDDDKIEKGKVLNFGVLQFKIQEFYIYRETGINNE